MLAFFCSRLRFSMSRSYSHWPSTSATRNSSGWVALISILFMRFLVFSLGAACPRDCRRSVFCTTLWTGALHLARVSGCRMLIELRRLPTPLGCYGVEMSILIVNLYLPVFARVYPETL